MATKTKSKKDTGKGQVLATLVQFDSKYGSGDWVRVKYAGVPFADVGKLEDYQPMGGTPLLDAVGTTIGLLDEAMKDKPDAVHIAFVLDESGSMAGLTQSVIDGYNEFVGSLQGVKPDGSRGRAMLVVFTDGQENQSREHSKESVAAMIEDREARGNFETVYLGANQDAWSGAAEAGMSTKVGKVSNFTSTPTGVRAAMSNAAMRGVGYIGEHGSYASLSASMGDTIADPGQAAPDPKASEAKDTYADTYRSAEHFLTGKRPS